MTVRRRLLMIAATATATAAAALAPAASAAPVPGTPVSVAPGVPGHGRAWELVSPEDTAPAGVQGVTGISASADRVAFTTYGVLPGASRGALLGSNLAVRGADGWKTTAGVVPGLSAIFSVPVVPSDPGLTRQVWTNQMTLRDREIGLYAGDPADLSLLYELGAAGDFVGASVDFRTLVFTSEAPLLPADAGRTEGVSLYADSGSELRLINVDDSGELLSPCGAAFEFLNSFVDTPGAVSRDGERVFFVSPPAGSSCPEPPRAYLWESGTTTDISVSQCTRPDCNGLTDSHFAGATPDGDMAFIITAQQLTNDDEDEISDLYRYEVETGELTRISVGRPPGVPPQGAVGVPVHVSPDGSRLYFTFHGRLLPEIGHEGGHNTYLLDGEGLHLIPDSSRRWFSEDRRYVVYETTAGDGDGKTDIYRYDAVSRDQERLSVGPIGGDSPLFDAYVDDMSADAGRVFFHTSERLVPQDRNQGEDVYEWFAGDVALVSSGAEGGGGAFAAISADGLTAAFVTAETLLGRDRDGGDRDIYVARVGGGLPEPASPADCEGPSCRRAAPAGIDRTGHSAPVRARRIELGRFGPGALRRIASTGWMPLLVEVPAPGRLRVEARARVGRRSRTVAAATRQLDAAGPVRLRVPLTGVARHSLARGDRLRVRLELRLSGLRGRRAVSFTLGGER